MTRTARPYVPLEVRCRVAMRQLGELWPNEAMMYHRRACRFMLDQMLIKLHILLEADDLHLSHEPPLAARPFDPATGKFTPDANDPDYLYYRTAEHHYKMTFQSGDHGQYSDTQLIKRHRRRERPRRAKKKIAQPKNFRWPSRPFRQKPRSP